MAYSLSFSEIFFVALERAIACMPEEDWQAAIDDEDCEINEYTGVQDALGIAGEINTCDTIAANVPIGVYLAEQGWHTAEVMPLAHYVRHNPDKCEADDPALVEFYEDSRRCWCDECSNGPTTEWTWSQLKQYLEERGFAVHENETHPELFTAAFEDWLIERW